MSYNINRRGCGPKKKIQGLNSTYVREIEKIKVMDNMENNPDMTAIKGE